MSLEIDVDDLGKLLALFGRQLLDLPQPAPEALILRLVGSCCRGNAKELVGRDAERLGESGQEMGGRPASLCLVVGDHPLRDAEMLGE